MKSSRLMCGFSLVEVMVALLVLAIGILGISKLQTNLIRSSSDANQRAVASSLAQEKIDELKSFIEVSTGAESFASLIVDGTEEDVIRGNYKFDLEWSVKDFFYAYTDPIEAAEDETEVTIPAGETPIPDFKLLKLTVSWTNELGEEQNINLSTMIDGYAPSLTSLTEKSNSGGQLPNVTYTPSGDPRVISVELGGDAKRETLVPSAQTIDGISRTKFTAYSYNENNVLIRQEDFENVACECQFDGQSTIEEPTRRVSHPEWNDTLDTYTDTPGELVAGKVKGQVTGNVNNADPMCSVCCRDHHDDGVGKKYDPFRSSDDYYEDNGNHKHYNGTDTAVTDGTYLESCRMKLVNGIWRVYQDWNMVGFKIIPLPEISDATTGVETAYSNYANELIAAYVGEGKVSGEALTTPPAAPEEINYTNPTNYIQMAVNDTETGEIQLSGRAIYLDFMDAEHLENVQNKQTAGGDYLKDVPYYEVEVVDVSNWISGDETIVDIGPRLQGNSIVLARGELEALATSDNAIPILANIRKSNSGLTDLASAVDFNAQVNPDDLLKADQVDVCVDCTAAAICSAPWGASVGDGSSISAFQSQNVVEPATCESVEETRVCNDGVLSGSYQFETCSVIPEGDQCVSPWGDLVANGSTVTAFQADTPSDVCVSDSRTCTNGALSGSYTFESCEVTPETCSTTVSGKANNSSDTIVVSDGTNNFNCSVANNRDYVCPPVSTELGDGVVSVISSGSVNVTTTVEPICGSRTVNF